MPDPADGREAEIEARMVAFKAYEHALAERMTVTEAINAVADAVVAHVRSSGSAAQNKGMGIAVKVCECGAAWYGGNEKYCPVGHAYRFRIERYVPSGSAAQNQEDDYELVRVDRLMVERLIADDSEPVVIVRLCRLDDGTCVMVLKVPDEGYDPLPETPDPFERTMPLPARSPQGEDHEDPTEVAKMQGEIVSAIYEWPQGEDHEHEVEVALDAFWQVRDRTQDNVQAMRAALDAVRHHELAAGEGIASEGRSGNPSFASPAAPSPPQGEDHEAAEFDEQAITDILVGIDEVLESHGRERMDIIDGPTVDALRDVVKRELAAYLSPCPSPERNTEKP